MYMFDIEAMSAHKTAFTLVGLLLPRYNKEEIL
jgi:hypothetical protein